MSRVHDALPGFQWSDERLAHTLWRMIAFVLVGPDLILSTHALWATRRRAS